MSKAAVRSCLAVACLLALTACSGANQDQAPSGSVSGEVVDATPAPEDATPAQENTTAAEQPLPPREGNPGISVATLPIGGGSDVSSANDGAQCVHVNWILSTTGDSLPAGLSVQITGAAFEPDVYRVADNGCQGPPCIGKIFRSAERACDLPIRPKDSRATGLNESEQVKLSAQGRVLCTNYDAAPCKSFVVAVQGEPQTISLALPVSPDAAPGSTADPGGTTPSGTTSPSPGG